MARRSITTALAAATLLAGFTAAAQAQLVVVNNTNKSLEWIAGTSAGAFDRARCLVNYNRWQVLPEQVRPSASLSPGSTIYIEAILWDRQDCRGQQLAELRLIRRVVPEGGLTVTFTFENGALVSR